MQHSFSVAHYAEAEEVATALAGLDKPLVGKFADEQLSGPKGI